MSGTDSVDPNARASNDMQGTAPICPSRTHVGLSTISSVLLDVEEEPDHHHSTDSHDFLRMTNPKVLFCRTIGGGSSISIDQLQFYLIQELLFTKVQVTNATTLILGQYDCEIDDNMFACVLLYLLSTESDARDVALLHSLALPSCSTCAKRK